jgi:hypothetical protein
MDSSWSEVQHICDPNLSKVSPVSAVCWDPYHELLWVGNDSVSLFKESLPDKKKAKNLKLGTCMLILWKRFSAIYFMEST